MHNHVSASALAHSDLSVRRYAGEYSAHAHAHAQILLGLSGRLELEIGGRCTYVDPSCGVVIPPGVDHGFMAPSRARVLVVDAPQRAALQQFKRFSLTPSITVLVEQPDAAEQIVDAVTQGRSILARRGLDLPRLQSVLDRALHEEWTTARMAALCALSPQRFHARMLELMGMTPQRHLRLRRLERAGQLLQAGHSLQSIASRVGYRSGSALSFALRREGGAKTGLP